jgi:exodeoxyribonuclease VII small subunit
LVPNTAIWRLASAAIRAKKAVTVTRTGSLRRSATKPFLAARGKPMSDLSNMTFEAALKELEDIVQRLERGDVELEKSIEIYERGEALKKHCDALLKKAEEKVEKIRLSAEGKPVGTEPLDVD